MPPIIATQWIWRDGEFVAWADAQVHVLCHSLQFGSSAFEGIRCYSTPRGPAIFRLDDHLKRMIDSCRIYHMDLRYTIDERAFRAGIAWRRTRSRPWRRWRVITSTEC